MVFKVCKPSIMSHNSFCSVGKKCSYHTYRGGCRGRSTAGGGVFLQGTRSPRSGPSTDLGLSRSRGWDRTEMCRQVDKLDIAECRDTRRLQEEKQSCEWMKHISLF